MFTSVVTGPHDSTGPIVSLYRSSQHWCRHELTLNLSDFQIFGFGQKNGFRSCDGNSVFSRDPILKEVSELNGIVRIIFSSVYKQF